MEENNSNPFEDVGQVPPVQTSFSATPPAEKPKTANDELVRKASEVKEYVLEGVETPVEQSLGVVARLKKRAEFLRQSGQAKTTKIPMGGRRYQHETVPADIQLTQLSAYYSGGKGYISYQVYKLDENGKKLTLKQAQKIPGLSEKIVMDGVHVVEKEVSEIIEHRQPIKVKEFYFGV